MSYNDNPYNFDESAARGTASSPPPNPFLNYYTPYQTTIAGQNVSIGDPSVTNDAQAIAYLRNQEQANAATGSVDSKYWQALNPGMSAKDMQAYQALRDKYVKGTSFDSLANHLGPWPGIVGLAVVGGAAAGAAAGAGGGAAAGGGSSVGMTAGGGALSTDAALGAATDAGVGAFGSGAAGLGAGAVGTGAAGAGAALGAGGAADAALPEILVQGSLPAASSGGLFAGAGDAALGALANSQVGQAPTSGSSSNPFTSFLTNHASDLAQLGLGLAGGGGGGGGGNGGGGGPGPAGVMPNYGSGYNDSNGAPLSSLSFPRSGFRDQGAFDYLLQSLGLPSPGAQAAVGGVAPQGYAPQAAPPSGLDNFAGMDFSSVFQGLVNPNSGSFGIPSPSPTAQASGTRGPAPDAMGTVNDLAGTFGNGGAAMGTKNIPTNPWIKISRGSYQ